MYTLRSGARLPKLLFIVPEARKKQVKCGACAKDIRLIDIGEEISFGGMKYDESSLWRTTIYSLYMLMYSRRG